MVHQRVENIEELPPAQTPAGELEGVKSELEETKRRLADLRVEFASLEMDFDNLKNFFLEYLVNERAAMLSVAKFAESRAMKKAP